MKHVVMTNAWVFGNEPFPAYRTNLVYGRNKRDREFLPVKDVTPTREYHAFTQYAIRSIVAGTVYRGTSRDECRKALIDWFNGPNEGNTIGSLADAEKFADYYIGSAEAGSVAGNNINLKVGLPTLPEDEFRVIKTREKGTILVVSGRDDTNRCLLFVGCAGGFRGGERVLEDGTTGAILKQCSAGNNCSSSTEVIILLEPGETIAFYAYGRRTDEVYLYTWTGVEIEKKQFSKAEWDSRKVVAAPAEDDVEVL